MMRQKEKKNYRRIISAAVIVLTLVLMLGHFRTLAASGVKQSGSMVLNIVDANGATSSVTIAVSKKATITVDDFWNTSTTWNVSLSGTNNHGITLGAAQIKTSKDSAGNYRIFEIPITFTQHAYYQFSSQSVVRRKYGSTENTDSLTYSGLTGTLVDGNTTRSMTLRVNGSQMGVCTRSGVWYTGTASETFNYVRPSYTVDFTDGAGNTIDTQTVLRGNGATAPKNPVRTGYTFAGWDRDFSKIMGNTTVAATWAPKLTTYVFHSEGGSGNMEKMSVDYGTQVTLTRNTFQRAGYQFKGWATEKRGEVSYKDGESFENKEDVEDNTIDLYAVWKKENTNWDMNYVIEDADMFTNDEAICGGNGTKYDDRKIDSEYAHRDTKDYPGYFSEKK